ncbi:hypothetical protein MMC20_003407 [Loxospora ochrophaea]|nr:hypothetical protein [Loxospora ochrophaea]
MAPASQLSTLSNPLVSVEQLSNSSSQLDGVSVDLEHSIRYAGAQLTQAAGVLLRLPQEIIAQAIITLNRFYIGPEGGSVRTHAVQDVSAASVYLASKISRLPQSPRSVLNVYAYLLSSASPLFHPLTSATPPGSPEPSSYYLSEGAYQSSRTNLFTTESLILRCIAYTTHVSLPHHLALTYLQTLGVLPSDPTHTSKALAKRTLEHLNTALLSPQILYLTHQPPALAVAAIYVAAKEVEVKLAENEWWEVFDVDREELGFLVVALRSMDGWVKQDIGQWKARKRSCPLTIAELEKELVGREEEGG